MTRLKNPVRDGPSVRIFDKTSMKIQYILIIKYSTDLEWIFLLSILIFVTLKMALSHAEPFLAGVVSCYSYYLINDLLSSVVPLHQVNTGKAQCRNHTAWAATIAFLLSFFWLFFFFYCNLLLDYVFNKVAGVVIIWAFYGTVLTQA